MNDRHPREATNAGTEPGLQPDSNGKHLNFLLPARGEKARMRGSQISFSPPAGEGAAKPRGQGKGVQDPKCPQG